MNRCLYQRRSMPRHVQSACDCIATRARSLSSSTRQISAIRSGAQNQSILQLTTRIRETKRSSSSYPPPSRKRFADRPGVSSSQSSHPYNQPRPRQRKPIIRHRPALSQNTAAFEIRWERLLKQLGSSGLQQHHWTEAEELLGQIDVHPNFASDPTKMLIHAFTILDRLNEETELANSRRKDMLEKSASDKRSHSLQGRALRSVLLAWRNHRRSEKKIRANSDGQVHQRGEEKYEEDLTLLGGMIESWWGYFFNESANKQQTTESKARDLDPDVVLRRAQSYVENGLVRPEQRFFMIILSELSELQQIHDLLDWQERGDVGTDALTYQSALVTLLDNPRLCHALFKRLLATHKAHNKKRKGRSSLLDLNHVNLILWSWAKSDERMAAKMTNSIFSKCRKLGVAPDVRSFTYLILSWAKTTLVDPAKPVVDLLRHMEKHERVVPNQFTYRAVLLGLERSRSADALDQAELILQEMRDAGMKQKVVDYTALMQKFADFSLPERVEALWTKMKRYWEEGDTDLRPDFTSFVIRLRAFSEAGDPTRATNVLKEMISLSTSGVLNRKPGTNEFNLVLSAWLKSDHPDAAAKAENGLKQMVYMSSQGQFDCLPNQLSHTIVIQACLKANNVSTARSILDQLKEQQKSSISSTFRAIINYYFECGQPNRLEDIFQEWRSIEDITSLGVHRTRILAWCKANEPHKAEDALNFALDAYNNGVVQKKPTTALFNDVIRAWAGSAHLDAAEGAERVLRRSHEYGEVDLRMCNAVLWGWVKSESPLAGARALSLLNWVKEVSETSQALSRPSFSSYCAVIVALLRSSEDPVAERIISDILVELGNRPRSFFRGGSCVMAWERVDKEIREGMSVSDDLARQFKEFRTYKKSEA